QVEGPHGLEEGLAYLPEVPTQRREYRALPADGLRTSRQPAFGEELHELVVGEVGDLPDGVSLLLKSAEAMEPLDVGVAVQAHAALRPREREGAIPALPDPEGVGRDAGGFGDRPDAVAPHTIAGELHLLPLGFRGGGLLLPWHRAGIGGGRRPPASSHQPPIPSRGSVSATPA